jgi:hypothetical protein
MTNAITIRVFHRNADGVVFDFAHEYSLDYFAGTIPVVGDQILSPEVPVDWDRDEPTNREILTVVGRMFNIGDNGSYVGLIVDARPGRPEDQAFI